MPYHLSDANTNVKFQVDSTWHKIVGKVKNFSGEAWLSNDKDPNSIRAKIIFPVVGFDTDNESRDKELRHDMHSDIYPNVEFELSSVNNICPPIDLNQGKVCEITLIGNLSISGVKKEVTIPGSLLLSNNIYKVTGRFPVTWGEFGVEDPSIWIAKLDPIVYVEFTLEIPVKASVGTHAKHT
jgi:polyisoprenoid-binding protein YceI